MQKGKGITLRLTLSILVIVSVLFTIIVGGYSAILVSIESLRASYLESNYHYAKKLAANTNQVLALMQHNMDSLAIAAGQRALTQEELDFWFRSNLEYFNSILIVNADQTIQAVSPAYSGVAAGTSFNSKQTAHAIAIKKPLVSEPFSSLNDRKILLISSPIFNKHGAYVGFAGGTIYLEEENNVLGRLLNEHFYGDESYVYVVDKHRNIIFHPIKERLHAFVTDNEVINHVVLGESGTQKVINSEGKPFFAGYAYEPNSGWGIISQTPASVLQQPLKELFTRLMLKALPLLLLIVGIAWWVAYRIAKPLHLLATFSEQAILQKKTVSSKMPTINSNIYEVNQLYKSLDSHLHLLNAEIQKDGLTGLANRKTFDLTIHDWTRNSIPFSLILLDIDHFKRINDTFGHVVGDEVLKYVSSMIRTFSRDGDLCFRYGGEEFGILVQFGNVETATQIAERLREKIAKTISPTGNVITVSIGISSTDTEAQQPKALIEMADSALYQSKEGGRNKTTVY